MAIPALWRTLTPGEQRELSKRFIQLPPDELSAFADGDFYLFVQWLYGRSFKLMASDAVECRGGVDFTYEFPDGSKEFLRVYPNDRIPIAMLHDVLATAEGHSYQKIHIYMRSAKPKAASQLQQEFPLTFEVVDLNGLCRRLADEQRRYHVAKISRMKPAPTPSIKDKLKGLLRMR